MKTILAIVLAVTVLTEAKVAPSTTANTEVSPEVQLSELISQAQTNINNLGKQIQEQLNLPDQETIAKTVKEQSTKFVTNVQAYMTNITEQVLNFIV